MLWRKYAIAWLAWAWEAKALRGHHLWNGLGMCRACGSVLHTDHSTNPTLGALHILDCIIEVTFKYIKKNSSIFLRKNATFCFDDASANNEFRYELIGKSNLKYCCSLIREGVILTQKICWKRYEWINEWNVHSHKETR